MPNFNLKTKTVIPAEPDWVQLGKLILQKQLLLQKSTLLVKHLSYSPVIKCPRRVVDETFRQFWLDLISTSTINYSLLQKCSLTDVQLFEFLFNKMKLPIRYEANKARMSEAELLELFRTLQGEIEAGNDNPDIMRQCVIVAEKLHELGKITKEDYDVIVQEMK